MMSSEGLLLLNWNCLLIADPWGKLKMLSECGRQALEESSDHRPSNADTVARGWTSPGLGHGSPLFCWFLEGSGSGVSEACSPSLRLL